MVRLSSHQLFPSSCLQESFSTLALLDSGANISAIPKSIAEAIGVNLSGHKTTAYGIGGKVSSVESELKVSIKLNHKKYSFVLPVMVVLADYQFPPLLGRLGFFSRFVISFDEYGGKVVLKERARLKY